MRRKNDILWKDILEVVIDDLLRFIFPDADQIFDMERGFEFLDKEFTELYPEPDEKSDTRFVDELVKVYRKDGKEEWLLLHVEIQGHLDQDFAQRMFRYYYRIYDWHNRPNPFALTALVAKKALLVGRVPDSVLLDQKLNVAKVLFEKGLFTREKIAAILTFLNNYVLFKNPQINRIFKDRFDLITGKKDTMDIFERVAELRAEEALERGRAEGQQESNRTVVKNLLEESDFSLEKIATIVNVPVDFVKQIKREL